MKNYEYHLVHIPRVLYTLRTIIILIVSIVIPITILMTFTYQVHSSFIIIFSLGIAFLLFKISSRYVRNHLYVIIKGDLLSIVETSTITQKKQERKLIGIT